MDTNYINVDMEFSELPLYIRDSFLGHSAQKELYTSGTSLIRIVSTGSNSFMGSYCITEYFYLQIKEYAKKRNISIQESIRNVLSVSSLFSPTLNLAVCITFGHNIFGFRGQASSQTNRKIQEYFPGGCEQIYIPNLTQGHQNRVRIFERL